MKSFMSQGVKEGIDFHYIIGLLKVETPFGLSYKNQLKPFMPGQEASLKEAYDRVGKVLELIKEKPSLFIELKSLFTHVKDLRQSIRSCTNGGVLTEVELFEIKSFVMILSQIESCLENLHWEIPHHLMVKAIPQMEKLLDPENQGIKTFYIYDGYSEALKKMRKDKKAVEEEIIRCRKKLMKRVSKDLDIDIGPNGEVILSKGDNQALNKLHTYPYLMYSSETYMTIKYTLTHTDEIDALNQELEDLKAEEEKEIYRIRAIISRKLALEGDVLFRTMDAIGRLDFIIAKAYMARDIDGIKPNVVHQHTIHMIDGRHIQLEAILLEKKQRYIPVSIKLQDGVTCITGANMGGKTVTLKMVALVTAMAQYGLLVPCKEMTFGLSHFIYVSTGDHQSVESGLSTFGSEIKALQTIIDKGEERGLILMDELARGTNPEEGYAISKSIVNFFQKKKSITLITTHYDHVANTKGVLHLQVMGLSNTNFKHLGDELKNNKESGIDSIARHMDYRLKVISGTAEVPRDAIHIARLMGLEEDILKDAERILKKGGYDNEKQAKS